MDPTDPSIVYLGGFGGNSYNSDTGLIRVNTTGISDAHSLVSPYDQTPGSTTGISTAVGATTIDGLHRHGVPIWTGRATFIRSRRLPELHPQPGCSRS